MITIVPMVAHLMVILFRLFLRPQITGDTFQTVSQIRSSGASGVSRFGNPEIMANMEIWLELCGGFQLIRSDFSPHE